MPPPATIYGHLAGVLGEWFEPNGLEFAYEFHHEGRADDVETIHPIEAGHESMKLADQGWPFPVNVEGKTNVQRRQFLLRPRLTLYLRSPQGEMLETFRRAFLSPYFSHLLGRSQDLATCHSARIVDLAMADDAYFENTLVPFDWRPWVSTGVTVLLPESIDYRRQRLAVQGRYLQVTKPGFRVSSSDDVTSRERLPASFIVDPADAREVRGQRVERGLHFWPIRGPSAIA